ncbi:50S ribosomal protein L4 [mine drainage metagenome]|uniref:50S ribosomal protein L4 n=2 Tax=mine drainage metagenome TaxID=410659 RepID=T1C002_9ZZZZ
MKLRLLAAGSAPVEVTGGAFETPFNEPLVHQVVTAYLATGRQGTKAQKSKAEVRGGGRKPWRQKGTGRARAGSIRSPLWRGGGRTFAARTRSHAQKINRSMYRGAMRSIVGELIRRDCLVLVPELTLEAPKTRDLVAKLRTWQLDSVLIVTETPDERLTLAARNLTWAELCPLTRLNPVALLRYEKVLMTLPAWKQLEVRLS